MGKRIPVVLCLFFFLSNWAWSQGTNALNNQAVIDMLALGLSDGVVIDKIHSAPATNFDTGLDALKALKAAKVSDAVIRAMINPKAPVIPEYPGMQTVTSSVPAGFPANAMIAYKRPDGSYVALQLCPIVPPKTKGMMMMMVNPLGKVKEVAIYRDPEAPVRIMEPRPVFYVKVMGIVSPRGLSIARLTKKGDHREGQNSSFGVTGSSYGAQGKNRIEVAVANVTDTIISVTPTVDLSKGEYIFATDDLATQAYDFGIDAQ